MTRDEAIEAVRVAVMQQRRENEINLTELLVDALFALGVLKLGEPITPPDSAAAVERLIKKWHLLAMCADGGKS